MLLFTRQRKTHKDHACTLLLMQLAILLMALYVASAGLAFLATNEFSNAPIITVIIGGVFPFQLAVVIIMEIIHLCIRIRRKRTTKCFLTWVSTGYTVTAYTANKAKHSMSDWLFIWWACTYIEIAIIDTLITSDSYWVYNVAKWRLRVALEGT